MNESHFNRGSWVVLGISIALLGIIFALNLYRFGLPTDGWVYVEGSGLTKNILGLPSALEPGDIPVSLDGLPFDGMRGTRPATWYAGGSVQYKILRGDQSMSLSVPIGNWTVIAL
jgi:membrane-associated protease RseP (regulator of RpoE activity)